MLDVDALAQEIRRVDGNHDHGAGALAQALMPFLSRALVATPPAEPTDGREYFIQERDDDMLICAKHWQLGSTCIARRPKLATNDEWRSTAERIVSALSAKPAVKDDETVVTDAMVDAASEVFADKILIYDEDRDLIKRMLVAALAAKDGR